MPTHITKYLEVYSQISPNSALLYTISRNLLVDQFRRQRPETEYIENQHPKGGNQEEEYILKEESRRVLAAIGQLLVDVQAAGLLGAELERMVAAIQVRTGKSKPVSERHLLTRQSLVLAREMSRQGAAPELVAGDPLAERAETAETAVVVTARAAAATVVARGMVALTAVPEGPEAVAVMVVEDPKGAATAVTKRSSPQVESGTRWLANSFTVGWKSTLKR